MTKAEVQDRINEKLRKLDSEQLTTVMDFVEYLVDRKQQSQSKQTNSLEDLKQLFRETQSIHADNPLTEAEIAAEVAAYRSGK